MRPTTDLQILGIWSLGELISSTNDSDLYAAQPADSAPSPRFDYALRTVSAQCQERANAVSQMARFVAAAAEVQHPNLIAVLDSAVDSAQPFLVMPRLTGKTLRDALDNKTGQPLPVIMWLVRQATQAVAALQAAGWVHGDIKPENLFVDAKGHVTVLDLGFALPRGTRLENQFVGTPNYAAPEQMKTVDNVVDPASDVYALGKVLMELLTLSGTGDIHQLAFAAVADLIAAAIAEQPSERPTAAEFASRLLRMEIETLGLHIQPPVSSLRRAA